MSNAIFIICIIFAAICIIVGLLLSKSGSSSGITTMSGQDMEIFKKTKDRGWTKIFQITMIILAFCLIVIALILKIVLK